MWTRQLQGPFKFAEHALGGMQFWKGLGVGSPRLIRHSLMLPVLADLYTQMAFEFDCRPAFTGMRIPRLSNGQASSTWPPQRGLGACG
jgi:hypothetical protein